MFVSECLNVNNKGHLTIGGCDTLELAKEFGTPLYVLDETTIRNVCKAYVKSFEKYYHGNGMPLYASKALSCKELCRIAKASLLWITFMNLNSSMKFAEKWARRLTYLSELSRV